MHTATKTLIEIIAANSYLVVAGTVTTIFAAIWAIYTFYAQKNEAIPKYQLRDFKVITDKISSTSGLEVVFHGVNVSTLTVTTFMFKNVGKKAIRRSDIPTTNPLRISAIAPAEIITHGIISSRVENAVDVKSAEDKHKLLISFEFLNRSDELAINIYHTGKDSASLKLEGEILDAKPIAKYDSDTASEKWFDLSFRVQVVGAIGGIWLGYYGGAHHSLHYLKTWGDNIRNASLYAGLFTIIMSVFYSNRPLIPGIYRRRDLLEDNKLFRN